MFSTVIMCFYLCLHKAKVAGTAHMENEVYLISKNLVMHVMVTLPGFPHMIVFQTLCGESAGGGVLLSVDFLFYSSRLTPELYLGQMNQYLICQHQI